MPNKDEVSRLLSRYFALEGDLSRLSGEQDENWLVASVEREYVLRICDPQVPRARVDFIIDAMSHLPATSQLAPEVIACANGDLVFTLRGEDGVERHGWLTTFISGRPLSHGHLLHRHVSDFGTALGQLDHHLKAIDTPGSAGSTPWDLTHPENAFELFGEHPSGVVPSEARRELEAFVEHTLPVLDDFQSQVIHNDANPDNVLLDEASNRVQFIDFGDSIRGPRVIELAVACSYLPLPSQSSAHGTAIDRLLRAYTRQQELGVAEVKALAPCIRARLALSVGIAHCRSHAHPERSSYVLRHTGAALDRLRGFQEVPGDHIAERWLAVVAP